MRPREEYIFNGGASTHSGILYTKVILGTDNQLSSVGV